MRQIFVFERSDMPRPIQATIDLQALRHNLALIQSSAPDALVWGVVKANAYGHGIERIFDALRAADGIALLDLSEAERVRQLGWLARPHPFVGGCF